MFIKTVYQTWSLSASVKWLYFMNSDFPISDLEVACFSLEIAPIPFLSHSWANTHNKTSAALICCRSVLSLIQDVNYPLVNGQMHRIEWIVKWATWITLFSFLIRAWKCRDFCVCRAVVTTTAQHDVLLWEFPHIASVITRKKWEYLDHISVNETLTMLSGGKYNLRL